MQNVKCLWGGGLDFHISYFSRWKKLKILDYYILPVCVVYSPGSCSYYIAEHFFSCFINGVSIACLVIENQSKPLKQLKVGVLLIQVVIWVISKIEVPICNLTIRFPSFPSRSLSVALEPRGGLTTSKGAREWNRDIARDVSGPRDVQMALTLISWECFPIPKLIQTLAEGCKDNNSLKSPIIITTISVSTVRVRTWLCPLLKACRTCTAILVSASSWSHLCTSEDPLLEKTFSPEVIFTCLVSANWKSFTFLVKRENSSSLLVSILQKLLPLFVEAWLHLSPFVSDLRLSSLWHGWFFQTFFLVLIPNNVYTFAACWRCLTINGIKMLSAYFRNVETVVTGRAWTTVAAGTYSKYCGISRPPWSRWRSFQHRK